jgi:acetyl esterase/lipase
MKRPGKLGDPDLTLGEDPRADARMINVMADLGMLGAAPELPINAQSTIDELLSFCEMAEPGYDLLNDQMMAELPEVEGVVREEIEIAGTDGNEIALFMHRPREISDRMPAILHLHGGGMVLMSATNSLYERWRSELAATGLIVVGVEFRNGGGRLGPHPYPAGLNDCMAALYWLAAQREALGYSGIVVSGESGGGNLSLATALRAHREGHIGNLRGVYAQCPYISNRYLDKDPELVSLFENDGLGMDCELLGALARLYDPVGVHGSDPLAWPLYAQVSDLQGLPPHKISVNELDVLRDEGLAYYHKLLAAGVTASCRTINGTTHAAEMIYRGAMPDVYLGSIRDIKGFAEDVCTGAFNDSP